MVFDGAYFLELFPAILPGLKNTLSITALSYAGGLVIGLLLAFIYRRRIPLLYPLARPSMRWTGDRSRRGLPRG